MPPSFVPPYDIGVSEKVSSRFPVFEKRAVLYLLVFLNLKLNNFFISTRILAIFLHLSLHNTKNRCSAQKVPERNVLEKFTRDKPTHKKRKQTK